MFISMKYFPAAVVTKDLLSWKYSTKGNFLSIFYSFDLVIFGLMTKVLNLLSSSIEFPSGATRRARIYLGTKISAFIFESCCRRFVVNLHKNRIFFILWFLYFFQFITLSNVIVAAESKASSFSVDFSTLIHIISSRNFIKIQIERVISLEILEIPFCWEIIISSFLPLSIEDMNRISLKNVFITLKIWINFILWEFLKDLFLKGDDPRRNYLRNFLIGDLKQHSELIVIYRCILWCSKSSFPPPLPISFQ